MLKEQDELTDEEIAEDDVQTEIQEYVDNSSIPVSYTHLRAHETVLDLVCRLLLEKKNQIKDTHHDHTYTSSSPPDKRESINTKHTIHHRKKQKNR